MNEDRDGFTADLERLLAPISAEHPSGESLRYEGTYDRVQDARREDDPNLPQGVWKTDLKRADWEAVETICLEALETRTKDLQLAVWLLDAWMHLHGVIGAREGIRVIAGFCESFWEDLYPELDDENGLDYRLSPLEWMNNKLSVQLKQIAISQPEAGDRQIFSWGNWETALRLESQMKRDAKVQKAAEAEGKVTLKQIRASMMLTPRLYYADLYSDLSDVLDSIVDLERLLEERGSRGPSLNHFRNQIVEIQRLVETVLLEREGEDEAEEDDEMPAFTAPVGYEPEFDAGDEKGSNRPGPIRSRTEAYQRLSEIADYLAQIEPHSPTPHLVRRAVSWGSMTVMELLQELVQDDRDLRGIFNLLGMGPDGLDPDEDD